MTTTSESQLIEVLTEQRVVMHVLDDMKEWVSQLLDACQVYVIDHGMLIGQREYILYINTIINYIRTLLPIINLFTRKLNLFAQ